VTKETGRSNGVTSLAVAAGATVQVTVAIAGQRTPDVAAATLLIEGASWGRVEVPVVVLPGNATTVAACVPSVILLAAKPGEVVAPRVSVFEAPEAATVVALLAHGGPVIGIKYAIAMERVRRMFTEEEIAELPPLPPSIREDARRNGYFEYHETGRAGAGTPLPVARGDELQVYLEIAPPEAGAPDVAMDTLVIEATTWQRIEIPVQVAIGNMRAVLSTDSITVRQGEESAGLELVLTSLAGPATDVHFRVGREGDPFHMAPQLVHVRRGATVTVPLRISADPDVFLGTYPVGLEVRSFDQLRVQSLPLSLTLRAGSVTVTALQPSVVALQGDRARCPVQVGVGGGFKRLSFAAGALPRGVRMDGVVRDVDGAATTVLELEFPVDSAARPVTNAPTTINWSASDGEHAGTLQLPFTVLRRPESRTFSQSVVTPAGTPLGGQAEMLLRNDGSGNFRGHMRATGLFSYDFRVRAVVRSANGLVAVMAQKSGSVYGTDTPGDRVFSWDDNASSGFVGDQWEEVRTASIAVSKSYEMSGVLGTLADVVVDVVEFVAAAALLNPLVSGGATLAGLVLVGSELGALTGVRVVGPGGLIGLVAAGGAAFLFGPGVILPVFVGGVMIGDVDVKHRPLSDAEQSFAMQVFGDTLPFERVILTNLSGANGQEFVAPNVDGSILLNMGLGFADPIGHKDPPRGYTADGQIYIHELTHVWQIAHEDLVSAFFWKAALDKLGGHANYTYGPPGPAWSEFGLEGQATVVDEWFAGTITRAATPLPTRRPKMNPADPYFGYIANNIRMAQP
jgi:hypothetical protein